MASFVKSVIIRAPVSKVFGFHERDDALTLLSPRFPPLRLISRTGGIQKGARVELRLAGLRWIALHTAYEVNRLFVDEQVEGPFKRWIHRHEFEDLGTETRLTDCLDYVLTGVPGWLLKPALWQMFHHRHRVTRRFCEHQ